MSACAVKVDFMHLIDHARAHVERHYRRPLKERCLRSFVGWIIPRRKLFRIAGRLGLWVRRLRIPLPASLRSIVDLLPLTGFAAGGDLEARTFRSGPVRRRVALLAGCAQRVLAPRINIATVNLLVRHGCEVVVAPGVECCGSLELHLGHGAAARRAAKRNIDAWSKGISQYGLDAIITTASGCGTTVKDYGHLFKDDPEYSDKARRVAGLSRDITEFLGVADLRFTDSHVGCSVAYHDACSLRNGQRVTSQPRNLLRAAGFRVHDVPESYFCCGSAGTYNLLQPETARTLGQRKARHVSSTGADILAVGNIGCITQLSRYTNTPVVHTVELLDWATGGEPPAAIAGWAPRHPQPFPENRSAIGEDRESPGVGMW